MASSSSSTTGGVGDAPSSSGSRLNWRTSIAEHIVTFKSFSPGFYDVPSILYSAGVGPLVKKVLNKDGKVSFLANWTLENNRRDYVSYKVRCSDPQKLFVCPSPVGVIPPLKKVRLHLISNQMLRLSSADFSLLRLQLLATTINVDQIPQNMGGSWYWKSLNDLWGPQRHSLTFPRFEVQEFRLNGGVGLGTGNTEFFNSTIQTFTDKVGLLSTAHRRLKELNRLITLLTGLGVSAIGGCLIHIICRLK